ncbi:cryptochrome/photolyase family protein [Chenggangzhangella methanolivorans]|uniref:Cryptochrome/photolyase family protein n=1 Tax=Chenggangzhangella methanolivorans TaxID=1437009 RepID=A0A9E6R7F4_9HYPH|nr:cryptochrome/photolyase family protein [Chenggangzhangella methanolivorans]QZN99383.1 cryptochrome/photolyase family protein [Chenggangzhangella methanolivorans]
MPKTLRLLLGDQLTRGIASLKDLDPETDVVLMAEVMEEATYVPHHKQKLVFLFAAMRAFAEELQGEGIEVDYVRLDDAENTGSLGGELKRAVKRHKPSRVTLTEPGEWRVREMFDDWREELDCDVVIREDDRFVCSHANFERWADGRKALRMEFFYREMRRAAGLLMDGDKPEGGQWNFDVENRKKLPKSQKIPKRLRFPADAKTREVIALVEKRFPKNFGTLEDFGWAVTRDDALKALKEFIASALENFGDYQDAMKAGGPFLFHGLVSPYINAGLLTPLEVCEAAETAYRAGKAPLNAVEGFIRQIIGWREYVRGIYWLKMPEYRETNHLGAKRKLPDLYWTAETDMNCLANCVADTRDHAYAHHIQRLMVLGNFALLAGVSPREVQDWYLLVYADAYEWVELPNVHGMVLFADGGLLGSKPYAASGAYIDRMSDYCGDCAYDVKAKAGEKACPFNYLYWDFLIRNEKKLSGNNRLAMPYRNLARFEKTRVEEIRADARRFLESLPATYEG